MRREPHGDELLAPYVDGVGELTPAERRAVEHALDEPGGRDEEAAVRGVIERLRALPPEGDEPDWAAMERAIRSAVGDEAPQPWWRRWRWLAPASTLVTALAVLLVVLWRRPDADVMRAVPDAGVPTAAAPPVQDVVALWLDGHAVEVDLALAPDALDGGDEAEADELGVASAEWPRGGLDEVGLLPSADLGWVDQLDGDALSRAERWLDAAERGKKG